MRKVFCVLQFAYYITFIRYDPFRRFGGWFEAKVLTTLRHGTVSAATVPAVGLRRALKYCQGFIRYPSTLRQRMLEMSYIVYEVTFILLLFNSDSVRYLCIVPKESLSAEAGKLRIQSNALYSSYDSRASTSVVISKGP